MDRTDDVLEAIYCAMCSVPAEHEYARSYDLTLGRYISIYHQWLVVGLEIDGTIAGGMIFHESGFVHLGILPRFRARWVRWLPPMLEIGFQKYGPRLTALSNPRNLRAQEFMERVGCVKVRETPEMVEYAVVKERMRYGFVHQ